VYTTKSLQITIIGQQYIGQSVSRVQHHKIAVSHDNFSRCIQYLFIVQGGKVQQNSVHLGRYKNLQFCGRRALAQPIYIFNFRTLSVLSQVILANLFNINDNQTNGTSVNYQLRYFVLVVNMSEHQLISVGGKEPYGSCATTHAQ
jgi:hypothetical protein